MFIVFILCSNGVIGELPFQMGKLAGEVLLFYHLASPFSPDTIQIFIYGSVNMNSYSAAERILQS